MFEKASRLKLRFKVGNSLVNVEDLWDLSLQNLDSLAISLNKEIKEKSEGSFIKTKTTENTTLELKFEVVKHIITVKLEEEEKKKQAAARRQRRQQLLEIIEEKENKELGEKSVEELKKELLALED